MLFLGISLFLTVIVIVSIKKRTEVSNLIDSQINNALRGICALEILIGHTCTIANEQSLIMYEKAMICCVGLFFMLSGYGLVCSVLNKYDYINGFLKKRLTLIFIPVIECYISYIIILKIQHSQPLNEIVIQNPFLEFVNWYIVELVVMYVFFFLFFRYLNNKNAIDILCIFSIASVIIMYNVGLDKCWYVSTLCFPLGIILKKNEKEILNFLQKKYWIKLLSVILLFTLSLVCFLFEEKGFILIVVCRSWATLAFCLMIVVFITKITIKNKFLNFLGKHSYSTYLYHIMLLRPLKFIIDRNGIIAYIITLLVCSLALGMCFEYINKNYKRVLKIYKRR